MAKGKTATELVSGKAVEIAAAADALRFEAKSRPEECAAVVLN